MANYHRKGMTLEDEYGIERAKEIRKKLSQSHIGNIGYWTGKHLSKEHIKNCSKGLKGRIAWNKGLTMETDERVKRNILRAMETVKEQYKNGRISPKKGMKLSEITKKKISESHKGEKHPNWKGGISFEPYPFNFNEELKELIRRRDNYQCQLCGMPECENIRKLDIHHIDYDKDNLNPKNLISLCLSCHIKTNFRRSNWINYFRNKLDIIDIET